MSIRTTITLDDDVLARVRQESELRRGSFRDTLNDLLRAALAAAAEGPRQRTLAIAPSHMGYRPGLNYDSIESLLERGEGELHR